ncbi:MAG TPA: threonine dehydratase [Azospirillum sp.]|nr:threonine dehydratase [Azospirillum sp.]
MPTLAEIEAAAERVHAVLPPTPQIRWPLLCERTGCEVWVKHENHQPVGAFKVRGGLVLMEDLKRANPGMAGVISATRGNHGQSLGFAAARLGLKAVIVVPHGNSPEKNAAMRALGVELVEHGHDFQEAAEYAASMAAQYGLHAVPSFHELLMLGVSSYSLEFLRGVQDLDTVYVPIGLGSGICGMVSARDALGARTRVVGVVSAHAPMYALSFEKGIPMSHPAETKIADGMACRVPVDEALAIMRRGVDRIVQVTDAEVEDAMRAYFTDTHNVAEGAGAAPLAALMQEKDRMAGRKVGLVLSGGNVDRPVFARVLAEG